MRDIVERAAPGAEHRIDIAGKQEPLDASSVHPEAYSVVERILAPDGMLWLAEPGRKTAQRFLNTAAALGWQGVSRTMNGPWPDGTTDTVNVHFLRRPTYVDQLTANLGGWRT